jgi:hypothetical protein
MRKGSQIWRNSLSVQINLQKMYSVWQQLDLTLLKKFLLIILNLAQLVSMEKVHFKSHILIGTLETGCQQLNNFTRTQTH